jgi:hypothetical protein
MDSWSSWLAIFYNGRHTVTSTALAEILSYRAAYTFDFFNPELGIGAFLAFLAGGILLFVNAFIDAGQSED